MFKRSFGQILKYLGPSITEGWLRRYQVCTIPVAFASDTNWFDTQVSAWSNAPFNVCFLGLEGLYCIALKV